MSLRDPKQPNHFKVDEVIATHTPLLLHAVIPGAESVMQTTDLKEGYDPAHIRYFDRARGRAIVRERLMRARGVVVVDVASENAMQMLFTQNNDVV